MASLYTPLIANRVMLSMSVRFANLRRIHVFQGHAVAQLVKKLQAGRSRVTGLNTGVDSFSNRNEYKEYLLGG